MRFDGDSAMADEGAPRFYGRRHGRRLRAGRERLLQDLLPRLAVPEGVGPVAPAGLFDPPPARCWLEIGFGGGEHIAAQAVAHPDVGLIGCEPFVNGVARLLGLIDAQGIGNIRVFAEDARLLLARLPAASIERVFILFPDPWPKKRHAERRLIVPPVLDALARVMTDGAELRFASDAMDYVRWALLAFQRHPAFEWTARGPGDWRVRPDDWPATRYEAKALAAGRRGAFLRFRRRARAASP